MDRTWAVSRNRSHPLCLQVMHIKLCFWCGHFNGVLSSEEYKSVVLTNLNIGEDSGTPELLQQWCRTLIVAPDESCKWLVNEPSKGQSREDRRKPEPRATSHICVCNVYKLCANYLIQIVFRQNSNLKTRYGGGRGKWARGQPGLT